MQYLQRRADERARQQIFRQMLDEILGEEIPKVAKEARSAVDKEARSAVKWEELRENRKKQQELQDRWGVRWTQPPASDPGPSAPAPAGLVQGPVDLSRRVLEIDPQIWSPTLQRFETQPEPTPPSTQRVVRVLQGVGPVPGARKPWSSYTREMKQNVVQVIKELEQSLPGAVASLSRGEISQQDFLETVTGAEQPVGLTMVKQNWLKNALMGFYNMAIPQTARDIAGRLVNPLGAYQGKVDKILEAAREAREADMNTYMEEISLVRRQIEAELNS